jgi:hypothetical protein
MNTDQLIRTLVADDARTQPVRVVLPLALLAAAAAAGGLFYATMGMRADLMEALHQIRVGLKQTLPVIMTVTAFGAVACLARPEGRLGGWGQALAIGPAIVATAFWITAMKTPVADWPGEIRGHSIAICLTFIPLIGLPILAASLWALRRGATTRRRLSGALAGLLAGSASASVYAAYCTDDSPMFWGIWYMLAITVVTGLGALVGPRALRW